MHNVIRTRNSALFIRDMSEREMLRHDQRCQIIRLHPIVLSPRSFFLSEFAYLPRELYPNLI